MKRFVFLIVLLLLFVFPVVAQEEATIEAPVIVDVQPGDTVVVESPTGDGDVVINLPDEPTEPVDEPETVPVSWAVIGLVVVGGLGVTALIVNGYVSGKNGEQLFKSQPAVVQYGGRVGLEFLRNQASLTPEDIDDKAIDGLAGYLGFVSVKQPDGRYLLIPKDQAEPPTSGRNSL